MALALVAVLYAAVTFLASGDNRHSALWMLLPVVLIGAATLDSYDENRQTVHYRLGGFELPTVDSHHGARAVTLGLSGPEPPEREPDGSAGLRLRIPYLNSSLDDEAVVLEIRESEVSNRGGLPENHRGVSSDVAASDVAVQPQGEFGHRAEGPAPHRFRVRCPRGEFVAALSPQDGGSAATFGSDPGRFCNVIELREGDLLHAIGRVLEIGRVDQAGWKVGPCALPDDDLTLVAVLDLLQHDAECIPVRRSSDDREGEIPWIQVARGAAGAGYEIPLRSFIAVIDGRLWMAPIDEPERVRVTRAGSIISPDNDRFELDPSAILVAQRSFSLVDGRLHERSDCTERTWWYDAVPSLDQNLCLCDYDNPGLCRRLRVSIKTHRFHVSINRAHVRLSLPSSPPATVGFRQRLAGDGEVSSSHQVAYASGVSVGADVQQLTFPFALENGGPLRMLVSLEEPCRVQEFASGSCFRVDSPTMLSRWASGSWISAGQNFSSGHVEPREKHLLQAVELGPLTWLAAWHLLTCAIVAGFLWPYLNGRAQLCLLFVEICLAVRVLLGYRVFALYPYDREAIQLAVVALAAVPGSFVALYACLRRLVGDASMPVALVGSGALAFAAYGVVGWVLGGWADLERTSKAIILLNTFLVVAALALSLPVEGWLRAIRDRVKQALARAWAGATNPLGRLAPVLGGLRTNWPVLAYLLLLAARGVMAASGLEKIGAIRVDVLFVPITLFGIAWWWGRPAAQGPRNGTGWLMPVGERDSRVKGGWRYIRNFSIVWWPTLPFLGPLLPGGDKGTLIMIAPPALVVALMMRHTRSYAASALVILVLGAGVFFSQLDGANIPPVAAVQHTWVDQGGQQCPGPDVDMSLQSLDVTDYEEAIDADNLTVRRWHFQTGDAARKIGTQEASRVAHSLAVLRRYAQGATGNMLGDGYLGTDLRPFSNSVINSQLSDGLLATLIMPDFGTLGLFSLLLVFAGFTAQAPSLLPPDPLRRNRRTSESTMEPPDWIDILRTLAAISVTWICFYMAAGNLEVLPLTGKDVPFLAVRSGSDLLLSLALVTMAAFPSRRETLHAQVRPRSRRGRS